jgi:hypothetical protein
VNAVRRDFERKYEIAIAKDQAISALRTSSFTENARLIDEFG